MTVLLLQKCLLTKISAVHLASSRALSATTGPGGQIVIGQDFKWTNLALGRSNKLPTIHTMCRNVMTVSKLQFMHKDLYKPPSQTKVKDNSVPKSYQLIYEKCPLTRGFVFSIFIWTSVRLYMAFTLCVGFIALCAYVSGMDLAEKYEDFSEWLKSTKITHLFMGHALVLFLAVLSQVLRIHGKLVIRIYHNDSTNEFIAVLRKNIFTTEKVTFKMEDAVGYQETRMSGNFEIKGRKCHVYEEDFSKFGATRFYQQWFSQRRDVE